MNEITKSIAFIGAAAAFVALAITSIPNKIDPTSKGNRMGQALFETFDTRSATGIEIVEIDAEKLEAKSIEIAQTDKGWWIRRPQKPDYPANADNQVKDVSTILLDLRILDVASEGSGEHAKYGVLDPSRANPGDSGVGKSIALKNNSGSNLAQLIIGNEVEGLSSTRYVRKPEENTVFTAEVRNANDVSTKFVDWVEKDFLDLDKWNIKQITLDNYEVNLAQGQLNRTDKPLVLDYDNSEWKLSGSTLTEKEELDKDKLDALKDALDDLKIIDVESKPAILVSNLKQGNEFFNNLKDQKNQAVVQSLKQKGFYTVAVQDPQGKQVPKVVSNKGEVLVGMKDGVEYVLRFGDIYRGPEEDENSSGDSRYIYAFARVNQSLLDSLALESVPKPLIEPGSSNLKDQNSSEDKGAKGDSGENGTEAKTKVPSITPPGPPPNFIPSSAQPTTTPPLPPVVAKDKPATPEKNTNSQVKEPTEFTKKKAERDSEIARINSSNANKQREFNEKVAKAQKRVNELNENLAEWYYVISNDVFKKIRLERNEFVKTKDENSEMPEEIKASHVLISFKGADRADAKITRSKNEAKAEAERIRGLIVNQKKDFAEMARAHSDGPSKSKGGDLGKFKFEFMAVEFSEAAFALEVGSVSEVVETGFGFHIIKRTE
ncbi:MAG: peptidylprolyl isomerase [Opitutae bacterium]